MKKMTESKSRNWRLCGLLSILLVLSWVLTAYTADGQDSICAEKNKIFQIVDYNKGGFSVIPVYFARSTGKYDFSKAVPGETTFHWGTKMKFTVEEDKDGTRYAISKAEFKIDEGIVNGSYHISNVQVSQVVLMESGHFYGLGSGKIDELVAKNPPKDSLARDDSNDMLVVSDLANHKITLPEGKNYVRLVLIPQTTYGNYGPNFENFQGAVLGAVLFDKHVKYDFTRRPHKQ